MDNVNRGRFAIAAALGHAKSKDPAGSTRPDNDEAVIDLLTDLMHACATSGTILGFDTLLATARNHHAVEVEEEDQWVAENSP